MIIQEIDKLDAKISAVPNKLEKYMAFTINKNLFFIDSMQFMNSSLDRLVKNITDNDFKYLSEEFWGDLLKLVKQKGVNPYEYINSFEKFSEDKLPDRCEFYSSLKDECISENYYQYYVSVKIIYMLLMFVICLKLIQWVIIPIFIYKQMFCY